jgi:ketosteroid isomerase-like protein
MTGDQIVAKSFMEALWAGDLGKCSAMMSADCEWHFQRGMPQAQIGRGRVWPAREALQRIIEDLFDKFDRDGFSVTLTRLIGEQSAVAVEYGASGKTQRALSTRVVM